MADAIVVLDGGRGERVATALSLFEQEVAPVMVPSADAQLEAARLGLGCDEETVYCVDPDPMTTAGEAQLTLALTQERRWEWLIVGTSAYHTSRARVQFDRCVYREVAVVGGRSGVDLVEVYRTAREAVAFIAAVSVRRAC